MKHIFKVKLQSILFTLVLFGLNNSLRGAEFDLGKIPQAEVEKILKMRLASPQLFVIMDPFDKIPTARALVRFEKVGTAQPRIIQKRVETRYHQDSHRFIKTIVDTIYEGNYPYKFVEENYSVLESADEKS